MLYAFEILIGAFIGALFCILIRRYCRRRQHEIFALALVYIAAIYVGPAVGHYGLAESLEFLVSLIFFALALIALPGRRTLLACAYIGHGLWDAVHGAVLPATLPAWYAPMCLGFDWAVAAWLFDIAPARWRLHPR